MPYLRFPVSSLFLLLLSNLPFTHVLSAQQAAADASTAVETISLHAAIERAEASEPMYASAVADSRVAGLERSIARAGLLPTAVAHNQYLFTQANGSQDRVGQVTNSSAPIFIANNSVHEYVSQASVTETLGLAQWNALTLADAYAARAKADLEIGRRGLVATVVQLYYEVAAAQVKLAAATEALDEAQHFLTMTQEREQAREAAHADVVRAQLQQQQRSRDVVDVKLLAAKASLDLGVLLFPDPRTPFRTEVNAPSVLPDRSAIEADAANNNAELRSALASLRASQAEITAARALLLPDLALNYTYGIDAPQFSNVGPSSSRNLGYSASATVDFPLWDWLATQHKVKQSQIRRDAVKVALSATQRRLIASLAEFYDEAAAARDQLASFELSATTARESLRLTKMRYTGGEGSVLEVVDAQNALLASESAQADGTVRYEMALANLQTLTGRF